MMHTTMMPTKNINCIPTNVSGFATPEIISEDDSVVQRLASDVAFCPAWILNVVTNFYWGNTVLLGLWNGSSTPI